MNRTMKTGLAIVLAGIAMNGHSAILTNWVADAGFEGLATWSSPNPTDSPWFSTRENKEADYGWVSRETALVNGGAQAMKFTEWGDGQANQWLGLTVDSNKIYEVRFSMRLDNKSTNTAHTNATDIAVLISTGPVLGGSATWKTTVYNIAPSTTNVWEEQVVHFDGADMADRQGEYIVLSFRKWNQNSEYWAYVDDVAFGEYEQDPVPDDLLVGWDTSSGAPDYSATGATGTLFRGSSFALNTTKGSIDGTFGTNSGASILPSCYEVRTANSPTNDRIAIQIQNTTGAPLQLNSISFDYGRWTDPAPSSVVVIYSYGALADTNLTPIASFDSIPTTDRLTDYTDFDVPLTNLIDRVLADGERATFRLTVSNASGEWSSGAFDNLAIFGGPLDASYAGWASNWGVSLGAENEDYDHDGLINLHEYALGGNPTNGFVDGEIPTLKPTGGGMEYIHAQRADDTTLSYHLELNTDLVLGTWTNSGYAVTGTNVTGDTFNYVTNTTDSVANEKFIRLIIK